MKCEMAMFDHYMMDLLDGKIDYELDDFYCALGTGQPPKLNTQHFIKVHRAVYSKPISGIKIKTKTIYSIWDFFLGNPKKKILYIDHEPIVFSEFADRVTVSWFVVYRKGSDDLSSLVSRGLFPPVSTGPGDAVTIPPTVFVGIQQ